MTYAQITAAELSASQARSAIIDLADDFSWETVAREMISQMSGDQAREFLEDFIADYAAGGTGTLGVTTDPLTPYT
jgi:DNA invertase Pin-like site-specific DNA recombinase